MEKKTVIMRSGAKVELPVDQTEEAKKGIDPKKIIKKLLDTHREQLEIFAAAFINHVGSDKAADYVLIHQQFPNKMIYRYELKSDIAKITENHDIMVAALKRIATPGELVVPVTVRKIARDALAQVGEA